MSTRPVSIVTTQKGLFAKLALPGPRTIKLGASFVLDQSIYIRADQELVPQQSGLIMHPDAKILFEGELSAGRQAVFFDAVPGQISGRFKGAPLFPEWWKPKGDDDAVMINCAVQAGPMKTTGGGHIVSLAGKFYYLKSEIDMTETTVALLGAGGGRTVFATVKGWKPTKWRHANHYGWKPHEEGNHSAVILMGGAGGNRDCYFSVVDGISISCYEASIANWDRGYVSGISSIADVQENSRIHDVSVQDASGSGIGFPGHNGNISMLNGLRITSVWIMGGMKRETVPILFPMHANNILLESFTVAANVDQALAENPQFPRTWPQVGISAKGTGLIIRGGHMEGSGVGIAAMQDNGINTIDISNISFHWMMDSSQKWFYDGKGFLPHESGYSPEARLNYVRPNPNMGMYEYSCGVLVASSDWDLERNYRDRIKVENLHTHGVLTCLLRDRAAGVFVDTLGQQQYPATKYGALRHYSRGDMFTNNGAGVFDPSTPKELWDREYYRLVV